jgi:hypothetical protein
MARKAITEAQQAPPSQARNRRDITCEATPDSQAVASLQDGVVPEETQTSLPTTCHVIIPTLSPNRGQVRAVSFQDTLVDHTDSGSIDSPLKPPASCYDKQPSSLNMAFQSPFKLSASRMSAREASEKRDGSDGNKKKKEEDELLIPNDLETESRFRVACSVAALLLFFTTGTSNTRRPGTTPARTVTSTVRRHYQTCCSTSC